MHCYTYFLLPIHRVVMSYPKDIDPPWLSRNQQPIAVQDYY